MSGAWSRLSDELNAEFGGHTIRHCVRLNGTQFAVTPGALKVCGSATHEAGPPTICVYDAPGVDLAAYLTGLRQAIRDNQQDSGPCVGCRHLVDTHLPQRFVAKHFTTISLHDFCGCNSSCIYCPGSEYWLDEKYTATFDHTELFRSLLAERMIRPRITTIFWGGGEPTLVKTYDATVDFLSRHRVRQMINTSGVRFSESTEAALRARTASVCVSLDSGTDAGYERVKRNPNVAAVWESVRRYVATGGDMVVKYIVFSLNSDAEEVEAFVDRCVSADVKRIRISVDARSEYGASDEVEPITNKELRAAATMRNLAVEQGIEVAFEDIWTPTHLDAVGEMGGFDAHHRPSRLSRLRRVRSIADVREVADLAVGVLGRRLG